MEHSETPYTHLDDKPVRLHGFTLAAVLVFLLLSGACNFVLLKILYNSYGEASAFFVSQGINVLYIVYGGVVVYPRLLPCGVGPQLSSALGMEPITPRMREPRHQKRFLTMGLLDCFGTFLTAMGANFVPGQYQPLLNQSLIPATMLASFCFLGTSYSRGQLCAALLIIIGAALSVLPQLTAPAEASDSARPDDEVRGYAVLLYWLSNVPMACSAVYKEARFSREPMDVTYLTQWVSIWQMLFGFVLAPLQVFPGVGSPHGSSWSQICAAFVRGWRCFSVSLAYSWAGASAASAVGGTAATDDDVSTCGPQNAWLLIGYVGVNFLFNTTGLYLTKHGGAVLNSISYSLLLPLTTIAFSLPLLGAFRESVFPSTYVGLLTVMLGFALWRYYQAQHDASLAASLLESHESSVESGLDTEVAAHEERPSAGGAAHAPADVRASLSAEGSARLGLKPRRSSRSRTKSGELASSPPDSFQERVVGIGRILRHSEERPDTMGNDEH